ncbi:hypothetical protein Tco_1557277, partial [Tanacetum coccineum]
HANFFPFFAGPYYATYPEGGIVGNCEFTYEEWDAPNRPTFGVLTKEVFKDLAFCKTIVEQFPIPGEMVRVKSLFDDQLTTKLSVLHCMMMSHGGELLARYRGLNQSHHEYVLSADSRLKGYEEKVASLTGLEHQLSTLKKLGLMINFLPLMLLLQSPRLKERRGRKRSSLSLKVWITCKLRWLKFLSSDEFSKVQGELLSLATSVGFKHGFCMHRTKDKFAVIFEHAAEPLFVILQLEPKKLVRPINVPTSRDARVSPPIAKESTMTSTSGSLELSANIVLAPSTVALEQNEEWVSAMVDGSDAEMIDGVAPSKSGGVFVHDVCLFGMSICFL